MGQLLWTCGNGVDFHTDRAGFRLVAGRAEDGGYRYAIMARGQTNAPPLATGSTDSLREAIDAAERAIAALDPSLAIAS